MLLQTAINVIEPEKLDTQKMESFIFSWMEQEKLLGIFDKVSTIFTVMFLIACFILMMATVFKVGQWKKYSQLMALFSMFTLIGVRGAPFIFLGLTTIAQIDNWLEIIVLLVTQAVIFASLIGIVVSMTFQHGYKLIEHPEFRKNHRAILTMSVLMFLTATFLPEILV
ncbi:hypothetical protein ACQKMI_22780 [Lysinibacillus sp. NPDC097214]|uniref:hypothetical protein n=1 Tax=Lysinibacillus sp. NPDC097214 TaxID=3390584 RepID=UPI003D071A7A